MMGNEAFRRLRNSTRQLSHRAKADLLKTFTDKMRKSCYSRKTVEGVMVSGVRQYYRKLEQDLQGGPPLNSGGGGDEVMRRRAKASASQEWFSRRRGGQDERDRKDNGWRNRDPEARGQDLGDSWASQLGHLGQLGCHRMGEERLSLIMRT